MFTLYLCRVDKNADVVIRIKWGKKAFIFWSTNFTNYINILAPVYYQAIWLCHFLVQLSIFFHKTDQHFISKTCKKDIYIHPQNVWLLKCLRFLYNNQQRKSKIERKTNRNEKKSRIHQFAINRYCQMRVLNNYIYDWQL